MSLLQEASDIGLNHILKGQDTQVERHLDIRDKSSDGTNDARIKRN